MAIKLKFKHQDFQERAAKSVCDIFEGQSFRTIRYDKHEIGSQKVIDGALTMWGNSELDISEDEILANVRKIQAENGNLDLSEKLEGLNFTVEMETGTGKTYTYIKTIYELNRLYGWSKFIIVVPSIAIREGVFKSFQVTEEHFVTDYGKRANYFIYNSANLSQIDRFTSDSGIEIMIINSQAFNAKDANTRRIHMELDTFGSRKPLDAIAETRPILIIDEPQSVEGEKTRESLKDFNPLFTLRYSATPREKFNLVYRLDALDAYNQKLVKKIRVVGVSMSNVSASGGYVYLKGIIKSHKDPTALIEFDKLTSSGIRRVTRNVEEGFDLYDASGGLEEYKTGFILRTIDGLNMTIEFLNGKIVSSGEISGSNNEEEIRRVQIRETIEAHLEKERQLYSQGIKVLSLFFIDEVAKYRRYDDDDDGSGINGIYAKIFEEEYREAVKKFHDEFIIDEKFAGYLDAIEPEKTHAGYFSIDKQKRMINSKINDVSAFDLIMKDKERLLSFTEPVRFIFSHSALREGWDNPNVFQICTLKNSTNDIRRRQEVGRGLRLCIDQTGERISGDNQDINELTVIASESYKDFAAGLQDEFAQTLAGREKSITITDARTENVRITLNHEKLNSPEFRELWRRINHRSVYFVDFDEDKMLNEIARVINDRLNITGAFINIERGTMTGGPDRIIFTKDRTNTTRTEELNEGVKYDLVGRLMRQTGLTRKFIVRLLKKISPVKFAMFKLNPEVFMQQVSTIINGQKVIFSAQNVKYKALDEAYDLKIFDEITTKKRHFSELASTFRNGLYDYAVCDSEIERTFAEDINTCDDAAVQVKLPGIFRISTPAGRYNPDWAIAFKNEIYFVAETKGSTDALELRISEDMKTRCAREHFRALSEDVKYEVVKDFTQVINLVNGHKNF